MLNALSDPSNPAAIVELVGVSVLTQPQGLDDPARAVGAPQSPLLLREILVNPWKNAPTAVRLKSAPVCIDHAAPLSPLRDRDLIALDEFFDRDDLPDLEQDVNRHLLRLFPEPCWEDKLSFLKDFLS